MNSNRLLRQAATVALLTAMSLGCSMPSDTKAKKNNKDGEEAHVHPTEGPHGGPLAEWGDEKYHAELVLDAEKKQATVYVLDGHVEKAVPIEAKTITLTVQGEGSPVQIVLNADPQEKDGEGKSSRFSATNDKFGEKLDPEKINASAVIKGTPYQGHFHVAGSDDPPSDEFKTDKP